MAERTKAEKQAAELIGDALGLPHDRISFKLSGHPHSGKDTLAIEISSPDPDDESRSLNTLGRPSPLSRFLKQDSESLFDKESFLMEALWNILHRHDSSLTQEIPREHDSIPYDKLTLSGGNINIEAIATIDPEELREEMAIARESRGKNTRSP